MDLAVAVPEAVDREAATPREHTPAADFNRAKWHQDQMQGQRRDSTKAALSQVSAEPLLVTLRLAPTAAV